MESNTPSGAFDEKLRELAGRNLDCVTGTDHVHAGIYRKAGGDHVVIAACLSEAPLLLLFITDKLLTPPTPDMQWKWQYSRSSVMAGLSRLNRESVAGVHELYEFPDGMIYTFKQCILLSAEPTDLLFCELIDRGIREFEAGIAALSGKG